MNNNKREREKKRRINTYIIILQYITSSFAVDGIRSRKKILQYKKKTVPASDGEQQNQSRILFKYTHTDTEHKGPQE